MRENRPIATQPASVVPCVPLLKHPSPSGNASSCACTFAPGHIRLLEESLRRRSQERVNEHAYRPHLRQRPCTAPSPRLRADNNTKAGLNPAFYHALARAKLRANQCQQARPLILATGFLAPATQCHSVTQCPSATQRHSEHKGTATRKGIRPNRCPQKKPLQFSP